MANLYRYIWNDATYTGLLVVDKNGGSGGPNSFANHVVMPGGSSSAYSPKYPPALGIGSTVSARVKPNTQSDNPTRTGYTFRGYSLDSADNPIVFPANQFIESNVTFTFDRVPSETSYREYEEGNDIVHETTYVFDDQSDSRTLYAKWSIKTYNISYDANGGSNPPGKQTKIYGEDLTLSSDIPIWEGHEFSGWATSPSAHVPSYFPGGTYAANQSCTLFAIWDVAGSTIDSYTDIIEVEASGTISFTAASEDYTHDVVLALSGAPTVTVPVAAGVSTATYTIPATWYATIGNQTGAIATLSLVTKSNGTTIGVKAVPLWVNVSAAIVPSVTIQSVEHHSDNATVESWDEFVQGLTTARITVSATAGTGATIETVRVEFAGLTKTITGIGTATFSQTIDMGTIPASGTVNASVRVTDGRDRYADATSGSYDVYPYGAPVVLDINTMRCDSDGTVNNSSGLYLKVLPMYSLSSVNGNNSFTTQTLSYMLHGSSTPIATITCASGTYYPTPANSWPINLGDAYDVEVTLTDALGSTVTYVATLPSAYGIWYGRGNDRLGLGMPPAGPGLYVDWDTHIGGTLDVATRRCSKQITSYGWFRAIVYEAGNPTEAQGASGFAIDMTITRDGIQNETHKVSLFGVHGRLSFAHEKDVSYLQYIDAIRYTYENSSPYNAYVDIHLLGNPQDVITVDFSVKTKPNYQGLFYAAGLDSVADTPSGETVAVYGGIPANGPVDVETVNSVGPNGAGNVQLGIADLGEVVNIATGASHAFNMENNTRHIFFCIGVAENNVCGIVCGCGSSGTTRATKMGSASNITFTQGTNKLTIKSANYGCCVLHLSYDVPT